MDKVTLLTKQKGGYTVVIIKNDFEYYKPTTTDEACQLAAKYWGKTRMLVGGSDLLVRLKAGQWTPEHVIDLKGIGIDWLKIDKTGASIGAACTLRNIEENAEIQKMYPAIIDAVSHMASIQVRNRASLGGNLCNAAPSADGAPPLMVYGAKVKIAGVKCKRELAIDDFFTGPGKTVIGEGEILEEITIPAPEVLSGAAYLKLSRTAKDLAAVGVASYVKLSGDGSYCSTNRPVEDVRIALGAVGPVPLRAKAAEAFVKGKVLTAEVAEEAAKIGMGEAKPISDVRATAHYRTEIVGIYIKRSLMLAKERAEKGGC